VQGRLSELQRQVLQLLSGLDPPWTLTGGGALALVSRTEGGFSPSGLAWVLQSLNVRDLANAEGYDPDRLAAFRDQLVSRLLD
jgi:hypothetical protein